MVGGTLSHSLPVPRTKAASVLPMPVANCPKRPGGAGVAVGAEQNLAGPHVAFLRQGLVADALVAGLGRVAVGIGHASARF